MTSIPRKLNYYLQILPLINFVPNWPLIICCYLFPHHHYRLRLQTGQIFEIDHYLSALAIKEVFLDRDYFPQTQSARVIIDIGANIGTCSVFMSQTFPLARVYSFEPDKKTFELLKTNLWLNRCLNVLTVNRGVSHKKGSANFYSCQASGNSSLNPISSHYPITKTRVQLTTLPDIIKKYRLPQIDILKIDAEGAEFDILLNQPYLPFKKIKEIILEYHDLLTLHRHEEIVTKLHQLGYKIIIRPHPLEDGVGIIHAF